MKGEYWQGVDMVTGHRSAIAKMSARCQASVIQKWARCQQKPMAYGFGMDLLLYKADVEIDVDEECPKFEGYKQSQAWPCSFCRLNPATIQPEPRAGDVDRSLLYIIDWKQTSV